MRTLFLGLLSLLMSPLAWAYDLELEVTGLTLGSAVTFSVSGADDGETLYLVRGSAEGEGPCPSALDGACMDILDPSVLRSITADSGGNGSLTVTVPSSLPVGLTVAFQAVANRGLDSLFSEPVVMETSAGGSEGLSAPEMLFGNVNGDDDDEDGERDWMGPPAGDDDFTSLIVLPSAEGVARGVVAHRLTLVDDSEAVRIWMDDEEVLGTDSSLSVDLDYAPEPMALAVEFGQWRVHSTLEIDELDSAGRVLDSVEVGLVSTPLLLTHHLQEASFFMTLAFSDGGWYGDNSEFVEPIEDVLGDALGKVDGPTYGYDVWIQDEFEFAYNLGQDTHQDFVIDSIRDRGLDDFPENALFGPDFGMGVWGAGWADTWDSMGNFETSPPVTVDGVTYPFGRIYYGASGSSYRPTDVLTDFLAEQSVQAPFEVDTSWLAVGHVDEFMSFIPDASSEKGFKLVFTDIDLAYEMLEEMDPSTTLPRYLSGHGIDDVEEFLDDTALYRYNQDLKDLYLEPILDQLIDELGLTDDDIIYFPGIFEEAYGPWAAALIPGMANLLMANLPGEPSRIFMADPFMRSSADADRSEDPFVVYVESVLPAEHEAVWVDDWEDYHMLLGEVHCGTNTIRHPTPGLDWWTNEDSLDLLGE
jgi:hypothetical protein